MTQQPPLRELCQHSSYMSVPPDTGAATKMEREGKKKKKLSICTQGHWFGVTGQRGMELANTVWFYVLITFSRLDTGLEDSYWNYRQVK